MVGYPLGWGDWADRLGPPSDGCPISATGIELYLAACEENYSKDDRRYRFVEPTLIERTEAPPFTLWLWACDDSLERKWYIVVGAGLGAAARNSAHRTRWLFAETAEDRSPQAFMSDAIAELFEGEETP